MFDEIINRDRAESISEQTKLTISNQFPKMSMKNYLFRVFTTVSTNLSKVSTKVKLYHYRHKSRITSQLLTLNSSHFHRPDTT